MADNIPIGFCQCGCGRKTNLATKTCAKFDRKKGEPVRFIWGHHRRNKKHTKESILKMTGENHHMWNGGQKKHNGGYVLIYNPLHPTAKKYPYVLEHVLIAEKVLGKYIPPKAIVHHINEDKKDNIPCNLVICEDRAYHNFIHMRMRKMKKEMEAKHGR